MPLANSLRCSHDAAPIPPAHEARPVPEVGRDRDAVLCRWVCYGAVGDDVSAPKCSVCNDTGDAHGTGNLDCTACGAAEDRAALNAYVQSLGPGSAEELNRMVAQWAHPCDEPGQLAMSTWIKCSDQLPEIRDDSVLAYFSHNGGIDMVHIGDYFADITAGLDSAGKQLYTKWYLKQGVTHWMPLPPPPEE